VIQLVAQRLMELDVETLCGAGFDVKSAERANSRNGYRDRQWDTRASGIELKTHSTNPLKRLNAEIKRRTDVVASSRTRPPSRG
jgi:transposase-like protein